MNELITDLPFDYWNKLANQTITISSLLGGFSIAIIANILVSLNDTKLIKVILVAATLAASFFLITIFSMTKLLLMTTEGYPLSVVESELIFPRITGAITFFLGIFSLILMVSLAGWTKSKRMGKFTTGVGILTLIFVLLMTT